MRLSVSFENTKDTSSGSGPVQVGWFLNENKGSVICDAAEARRPETLLKPITRKRDRG